MYSSLSVYHHPPVFQILAKALALIKYYSIIYKFVLPIAKKKSLEYGIRKLAFRITKNGSIPGYRSSKPFAFDMKFRKEAELAIPCGYTQNI